MAKTTIEGTVKVKPGSGTRVLSDWLIVRITAEPRQSFLDRMIGMVERAKRQKTPNEIAMSGRAVEAAGDVDVLLLDKTGTITLGNRQATEFIPADGVTAEELADAAASSSSNLGPLNPALAEAVKARIEALRKHAPNGNMLVPIDLVTASGSGLDPHISITAAEYQIPRVARARGLSEEHVRALVLAHTQGRQFGVLSEPRVKVLLLNLALDKTKP